MSTFTKEFTKEQLVEHLRTRIEHRKGLIASMHIDRSYRDYLKLELLSSEIALASLEAEPVAYADPQAFRNFQAGVARREWMWHNPGEDLIPVYTAPPAPVVPDEIRNRIKAEGLAELLKDASENAPLTTEQWETLTNNWFQTFAGLSGNADACRAAMLQGAEPVTTAYKLRDAVEIIRNSGIEIDAEKIFAERDVLNTPDCWCRTCRPVTVTDMRFVVCPDCGNKRCPHANDHRNACTGSNEPGQEGSAYPAAPQQEVKP